MLGKNVTAYVLLEADEFVFGQFFNESLDVWYRKKFLKRKNMENTWTNKNKTLIFPVK